MTQTDKVKEIQDKIQKYFQNPFNVQGNQPNILKEQTSIGGDMIKFNITLQFNPVNHANVLFEMRNNLSPNHIYIDEYNIRGTLNNLDRTVSMSLRGKSEDIKHFKKMISDKKIFKQTIMTEFSYETK